MARKTTTKRCSRTGSTNSSMPGIFTFWPSILASGALWSVAIRPARRSLTLPCSSSVQKLHRVATSSGFGGIAAAGLAIGDRVWFRHTKAGELSEHLEAFSVVDGDRIVGEAPTYRGEGKVFL